MLLLIWRLQESCIHMHKLLVLFFLATQTSYKTVQESPIMFTPSIQTWQWCNSHFELCHCMPESTWASTCLGPQQQDCTTHVIFDWLYSHVVVVSHGQLCKRGSYRYLQIRSSIVVTSLELRNNGTKKQCLKRITKKKEDFRSRAYICISS